MTQMKPIIIAFILLGAFPLGLHAQKATLSSSTKSPVAGQRFTLTVQADSRDVGSPGILDLPGIALASRPSRSTSMSFFNGQMSANTSYHYQVVAEKEGPLEIQGIEVTVDGKKVKTNSLKLDVQKASARNQPQPPHLQPRLSPTIPRPPGSSPPRQTGRPNTPAYPAKIDESTAYLKVVPMRKRIYVGETAEAEVKAYLDAGIPIVNFARELNLKGEDFIFQPTVGPDAEMRQQAGRRYYHFKQETVDGRLFNVLTYKTTMTAVKPGSFTLAPVDFTAVIQLPRQNRRQRRPRSLLDSVFGDPFDDPFFDSVMNNRRRELRLQSEPVDVEVISLPTEGRPPHFAGAIGRFSLDVVADKKAMKVDEALKLTATITGHGNFERIGELDITAGSSWKAYPPKIHFNSTDDLNLSGEKKFEYTYIAASATDQSPSVQFCYFDPQTEKYVSHGGSTLPVAVTGSSASALTNQDLAALADSVADPAQTILASVAASPGLTFFQGGTSSLLGSTSLLAINGGAAALALGLVAWQWRRRDRPPTPKKRQRLLLKEQAQLLSRMRGGIDPTHFDKQLLHWLALRHQLESPADAVTDEWEAAQRAINNCEANSVARMSLEDFLSWANARRWSGRAHQEEAPSEEQQQAWLQAVTALQQERSA